MIDLLAERPCLWNIVEKSYHSREIREQGFEELKCLPFHHPQEVAPMKKLQFDDNNVARCCVEMLRAFGQAPVVQTMDSAIHRINRYPLDK